MNYLLIIPLISDQPIHFTNLQRTINTKLLLADSVTLFTSGNPLYYTKVSVRTHYSNYTLFYFSIS